jgi:hypothetical protein
MTYLVAVTEVVYDEEYLIKEMLATGEYGINAHPISHEAMVEFIKDREWQIEHHLFPRISHVHYYKIKPIVQEWCKKNNVKYNYYDTLWNNICSCYKYLELQGGCYGYDKNNKDD